jgi:hypothetical protein
VADHVIHYGMIVLDDAPVILRVRGQPMVFGSPDQTLEYAKLHGIMRWMVYGRPDGWWPVYTLAGPVNPLPEPPPRVDLRLTRHHERRDTAPSHSAIETQPRHPLCRLHQIFW